MACAKDHRVMGGVQGFQPRPGGPECPSYELLSMGRIVLSV